jgi:hypothetical protein
VFWLVLLLGLFVILWLAIHAVEQEFTLNVIDWILISLLLLVGFFYFFGRRLIDAFNLRGIRNDPRLLEKRSLTITEEGLTQASESGSGITLWHAVERIVVHGEHAFIYLSKTAGVVLPKRAFADEKAFGEFVEQARRYQQQALPRRDEPAEGQA